MDSFTLPGKLGLRSAKRKKSRQVADPTIAIQIEAGLGRRHAATKLIRKQQEIVGVDMLPSALKSAGLMNVTSAAASYVRRGIHNVAIEPDPVVAMPCHPAYSGQLGLTRESVVHLE